MHGIQREMKWQHLHLSFSLKVHLQMWKCPASTVSTWTTGSMPSKGYSEIREASILLLREDLALLNVFLYLTLLDQTKVERHAASNTNCEIQIQKPKIHIQNWFKSWVPYSLFDCPLKITNVAIKNCHNMILNIDETNPTKLRCMTKTLSVPVAIQWRTLC